VSPSDRRTAERDDVLLPTEQVPAFDPDRRLVHDEPENPIPLPTIVPATFDEPEDDRDDVAPSTPEARTDGNGREPVSYVRDVDDEWEGAASAPVIVTTRDATGGTLRPLGRRPRVRKVTRVLRHIDPWSAFKIALVFSIVLYGVLLTAGVLLWNVALNTGTVDNVERWFTQFGWETFELKGGEIYHNGWIAGLFGIVGLTGLAVLAVTLFNLVSDMVGGVRMTVLEEEVIERTVPASRRFVVRRPTVDESTNAFDLDGELPASATGGVGPTPRTDWIPPSPTSEPVEESAS
jgi:hypothetical protein